jgi:membrane-associated phospholipid phosphatase
MKHGDHFIRLRAMLLAKRLHTCDRARLLGVALMLTSGAGAIVVPSRSLAQHADRADPTHRVQLQPADWRFWSLGAAMLAGTVASDRWLHETLRGPGAPLAQATARLVEPLGRAHTALVGVGTTFVMAHLLDAPEWAHATARVGAGYLAADAVTAVLKPLVGRARPAVGAGAAAFHLLAADEAHHSFPSGHATHAFALAAAVAAESRRPWVTAAAYGTAALVGWSRVHDDAHWASDVVAGALVGTSASLTTVEWLQRRRDAAHAATTGSDAMHRGLRFTASPLVSIAPTTIQIRLAF